MTKHILAIVVLIALVVSFLPTKEAAPLPPPSPVSNALSSASRQDKDRVAAFYGALADVLERDDKVISTVGKFREVHGKSLDLAFKGTDLPGKYPGLDLAINSQLTEAVGTADVPLPPAKRAALVQALKGISNAAK